MTTCYHKLLKLKKRKRFSDGCCRCLCLLFFSHKSLPAPQDKVYLQQSPAVELPDNSTGMVYVSPASHPYGLTQATRCVSIKKEKKTVTQMLPSSILLPPSLGIPLFHVTPAVVRHASYCGESDNVMLCETYSAYQRFSAVQTVAHWHLFFFSILLQEPRADPGSVI